MTQLEASTHAGSVFAVCEDAEDRGRDGPDPTAGLVFYDLKSCLRGAGAESAAKPKRRRRTAAESVEEGAGET